ncbi:(2Fe-2S)-binding protein [Nocardia sp. CA-290969]|uniref:(2Fe-2S)-binding protein n=1 Tax=Nocardia sp. CA-290969 TaxID=3239986 RepID=UPI003D8DCCA6
MRTARGEMLADESWLAARIAELNASWRTDSMRVGATLWWCMTASALVEPVVRALARETPITAPALDRLELWLRPDGTVEKVRFLDTDADAAGPAELRHVVEPRTRSTRADSDGTPRVRIGAPESGVGAAAAPSGARTVIGGPGGEPAGPGEIPVALRATLSTVIDRISAVSGVRGPALWAVVTDVVASWAVDARAPEIGQRLAAEIGSALPAPRFVEVGGRTFVKRASCCLVYEAPNCEKCVSCPKRPPTERAALLADYARRA